MTQEEIVNAIKGVFTCDKLRKFIDGCVDYEGNVDDRDSEIEWSFDEFFKSDLEKVAALILNN